MKRFLSVLLFLLIGLVAAWGQTSQFWKKGPGALTLAPENANWGSAESSSVETFPFWNSDGATVHLRVDLGAATGTGYEVFLGFVPDGAEETPQGSGNVVGLSMVRSAEGGSLVVGLTRKEAGSSDPSIRGSQFGDLVPYGKSQMVPLAGNSVEVTLKVNDQTVSAQIGSDYSESHPLGLSAANWKNARLVLRCKNEDAGRGSITVDEVSVDSPQQLSRFVQPIDLRSVVNMGFRDEVKGDEKGGWTDQGENDLQGIVTGRQNIRSIPFDIIDPSTNGGKSCLMLFSKNRMFFPKESAPVPVHQKANSLLFLHSAAWAHENELAAHYTVRYEDGTSVSIPISIGKQLNDWWGMQPVSNPQAGILLKIKNDSSLTGEVGIYGYRWVNPSPAKAIDSIVFQSALGDPVVGILAVSLVKPEIGSVQEDAFRSAFEREVVTDLKRFPPDRNQISDQVSLQIPKKMASPYVFSVAGSYSGGGGGKRIFDIPGFAPLIRSMGGISRFPYGLEISFYFWPYSAEDWYPVLGKKGGTYGTIERWYYKYGGPKDTLSYQTMLASYKAKGLKLDLLLNTHAMFNGQDFVYVKTLPEEKMKTQNPLEEGTFNRQNMEAIVRNNATLVDYVIKNGYTDTVSYWEMDNERWDMPGAEYAEVVAAHVKMLRSKLPKAKVIVCLGELGPYTPNPEGTHAIAWSRDLLKRLQELGMDGKIDLFAPHIYPNLADNAEEITQNYLDDWSVRNIHRSLDYMSGMLDKFGFGSSRFFVSEWATSSDLLGSQSRNDLITSMAAAVATAKDMMAIYSHPRTQGSTWHQFMGDSYVSRALKMPLSKWGEQTVFLPTDRPVITTPTMQAMELITEFGRRSSLVPCKWEVPKGVHYLCGKGSGKTLYFVVNSSSVPVKLPLGGVVKRSSLFADKVLATSVLKYGSYGDALGDVQEILPREFKDATLPPFSVNLIEKDGQ